MAAPLCVVFCMDTEGPCADPGNAELLGTWAEVDAAMDKLFDPAFRARCPDPAGGSLKIGWFFLTWTGFATNPRQRAFGYHAVRDHYLERWGSQLAAYGDEQCWHYHHPAASGVGNEWGLDWSASDEHDRILSRQVLERDWWPACFRAGGTILDAESSRWIDRWFPFDYSNRAPLELPGLVDWSSGVADWALYHPDPEDFRRPGSGRRRLARTLDLVTGVHVFSEDDMREGFERASGGLPAVVSVFDHDYRDIADRIDAFRELVARVASEYPQVEWRFAGPVEAARAYLGGAPAQPLQLEAAVAGDAVHVWATEPLFQSLPWLAVRTPAGEVVHLEAGLVRQDEMHWTWRPELDWEEAGFAGSTDFGATDVVRVGRGDGPGAIFLGRETRLHPTAPRSIWEYTKRYTRSLVARGSGAEPELDSAAQTRELLAARLEPGASVLDVGCGAGHLRRSLEQLGVEYHGIDSHRRAIEIGRLVLADTGLSPARLRSLAVEQLPPGEEYDAVVCLSTLLYAPDFRLPLDAMANAARRLLVVRSSFGEQTEIRYLPDVLLEPGFEGLHAYFSIIARAEVEAFLTERGFVLEWIEDRRQRERFGGEPEVVGGVPLPYEFLVAERR